MNLFDVYPLFNIEIVKGKGCHVWDTEGNEYLDLYGGHAVISVGHSHPTYVKAITEQVRILFQLRHQQSPTEIGRQIG
mgnify:CR=1 FL=1